MKTKTAVLQGVDPRTSKEVLSSTLVGRLTHGPSGELLVEFRGGPPRPARLVASLDRRELSRPRNAGREVLIVLDQGDTERPVILDLMERLPEGPMSLADRQRCTEEQRDIALVDGKRVVIEAEREMVLKCGKGTITIRADGKIVVRGTQLLSRSSGVNRIKGGSVRIN